MRFTLLLTALFGALLLGATAAAGGSLSGSAELRYAEFEARESGETAEEVSHFTQQYSLLWQSQGRIAGGRAGQYKLGLGYMWTSVDSEVNGQELDLASAGKVLYRGEMLLAPGGLPFRLHLYSYDQHRTVLTSDQGFYRIIDSDGLFAADEMVTNYSDGQHITSGATLLVGIRNGSYLGAYRDLLSQLPRLLVDYKEERVRDLKSFTPQHYRMRNLAFISLNKKDNWFHYRHTDYEDHLNPEDDYLEKSIMLGTVDHNLQRQWINLTNWIRISADGTLTKSEMVRGLKPVEERNDLNLFAMTRRTNWQLSNFTTFNRTRAGERLDREFAFPLFLSGELDRATAWRFRFLGDRRQVIPGDTGQFDGIIGREFSEDDIFASMRAETFRTGRYILTPELSLAARSGNLGEGQAARAGFEVYSNKGYGPPVDIFGAYSLAYFTGTGSQGLETDFLEHVATGRLEANLSARLRTGLGQELIYGTGTLDRTVVSHIAPRSDTGLLSSENEVERDGTVVRSKTTWFAEHTRSRLTNRLALAYDYLSTPDKSDDQLSFEHKATYDHRLFSARSGSSLVLGTQDGNTATGGGSVAEKSFQNQSQVNIAAGRSIEAGVVLDFEWQDADRGSSTRWRVEQNCSYSIFKVNGVVRKLAELREKFEYERFARVGGQVWSETRLSLAADYYPTRYTLLGGRVRGRLSGGEGSAGDDLAVMLVAGLNFSKFQLSFDYAYGTLAETATVPDRTEQRWEVTMRKTF